MATQFQTAALGVLFWLVFGTGTLITVLIGQPLGIMAYQGEYSSDWNLILAFITLTILPTIIIFLLAQKHIVAGLTAGAVKG